MDSKLECTNYRRISLPSSLDRIIGKLMYKRLMGFLNDQKILYKNQFGYPKYFSTGHAVINLIENIEHFCFWSLCWLAKAFDTVDHNILFHKLSHYGIRDIDNCWFSSYLSNRQQFKTINGFDSETQTFQCAMPQGSLFLGPILFV